MTALMVVEAVALAPRAGSVHVIVLPAIATFGSADVGVMSSAGSTSLTLTFVKAPAVLAAVSVIATE